MLSSCTVALNVRSLGCAKLRPLLIASVNARRGIAALRDIERAVYLDFIVDVAIQGCNLEHQTTGHPRTSIMYPVQDLTESGLVPNSVPQPLAKAAST